jgi:NAD-dependent DNA ligase
MTDISDPHGQPYNVAFNRSRRTERDLSELLGLAKGVLADGVVNEAEATFLHEWGRNHPDAVVHWPLNLIFSRLKQFFADGHIDEEERAELQQLLTALVGGTASIMLGYDAATALPLDDPPPLICWGPDEVYVFTGQFAYGTRNHCEREIHQRGGRCDRNVTKQTTFLVIGTFGSRDWQHTSFGTKIRKAVELRQSGFALRIVGEDHWAQALW